MNDPADELVSQCPNCVDDPSMFTCKTNGMEVCLKKSLYQCYGRPSSRHCDGHSNTLPSQCDNCAVNHLFKCRMSGVDACLTSNVKCDGRLHCPDYTDELASQCPGCVDDPTRFTCRAHGKMVCLSKDYQCDGQFTCDDGSDDHPKKKSPS